MVTQTEGGLGTLGFPERPQKNMAIAFMFERLMEGYWSAGISVDAT